MRDPRGPLASLLLAAGLLAACGDDGAPGDAGARRDAGRDGDARVPGEDAGPGRDAGSPRDGGRVGDAGPGSDAEAPPFPAVIDASSIQRKLMMGYQGWFAAAGDGSPGSSWRHWARGTPRPDNLTFDAFPDLREYDAAELFETDLDYADGRPVALFSAYTPATVERHFRWMREHGIDGVFLQEFVVELTPGSDLRGFRDRVTDNVRAGAEAHGRAYAIMYDVSGADLGLIAANVREHWSALRAAGHLGGDRYLHESGLPVVALWGFGFTDRAPTPDDANALLDWFQRDAPAEERAYVVGGVPAYWRSLDRDSASDPAWAAVYRRFDAISPWTVGRYADDDGARNFRRDRIEPDLVEARAAGADYLPVAWPGFSWANLMPGRPLNEIPRRGGRFFWTMVHQWITAGATMIYVAMFDEVDEATAMFEVAETAADAPVGAPFLTLDADGEPLPSDFYLRLAGEAGRVLRGERPSSPERPIDP